MVRPPRFLLLKTKHLRLVDISFWFLHLASGRSIPGISFAFDVSYLLNNISSVVLYLCDYRVRKRTPTLVIYVWKYITRVDLAEPISFVSGSMSFLRTRRVFWPRSWEIVVSPLRNMTFPWIRRASWPFSSSSWYCSHSSTAESHKLLQMMS